MPLEAYVIIFCAFCLVIAPILAAKPTPKMRKIQQLRQKAESIGFKVKIKSKPTYLDEDYSPQIPCYIVALSESMKTQGKLLLSREEAFAPNHINLNTWAIVKGIDQITFIDEISPEVLDNLPKYIIGLYLSEHCIEAFVDENTLLLDTNQLKKLREALAFIEEKWIKHIRVLSENP